MAANDDNDVSKSVEPTHEEPAHDELLTTSDTQRYPDRDRKLTELGLSNLIANKQRTLKNAMTKWRRISMELENCLLDNAEAPKLNEVCSRLDNEMDKVYESYMNLETLSFAHSVSCNDMDIADVQDKHQILKRRVSDSKQKIPYDIRSQASKKSSVGTRSHISARSKISTSSQKLHALTEAAVLGTDLKYLELEMNQKLEFEKIQISKRLDACNAKVNAILRYEHDEMNNEDRDHSVSKTFDVRGNPLRKDELFTKYFENTMFSCAESYTPHVSNLDPEVNEFVPTTKLDFPDGLKKTDGPLMKRAVVIDDDDDDDAKLDTFLPVISSNQPIIDTPAPSYPIASFPDGTQKLEQIRRGDDANGATPLKRDASNLIHRTPDVKFDRSTKKSGENETAKFDVPSPVISSSIQIPDTSTHGVESDVCSKVKSSLQLPIDASTPKGPVYAASGDTTTMVSDGTQPNVQDFSQLMSSMVDALNLNRLKPPEPGMFYGDPLQYPLWNAAFTDLVDRKPCSGVEKLYYLKRYLGGPASIAVSGFFLMRTDEAYKAARRKLEERFGDPSLIADAFLNKLEHWPKIPAKDGTALMMFSDFLSEIKVAMEMDCDELDVLNSTRENKRLLLKLPDTLVGKWNNVVAASREKHSKYPKYEEFCNFIAKEAKKAIDPISSFQALGREEKRKPVNTPVPRRTLVSSSVPTTKTREVPQKKYVPSAPVPVVTRTSASNAPYTRASSTQRPPASGFTKSSDCRYCKSTSHMIEDCPKFTALNPDVKREYVSKYGLCFGCLSRGHIYKTCRIKRQCKECSRRHPTCLHGCYKAMEDVPAREVTRGPYCAATSTKSTPEGACGGDIPMTSTNKAAPPLTTASCDAISMCNLASDHQLTSIILPVWVSSNDSEEYLVYALLDTQSDTTFLLNDVADRISPKSDAVEIQLSTMSGTSVIKSSRLCNLKVRGYNSSEVVKLPVSYSRDLMPALRSHIPVPETAARWPHLQSIVGKLSPLMSCEIGLLIGYNCPEALAPRNVILGSRSQPYGIETTLGWAVVGCSLNYDDENCDLGANVIGTKFVNRISTKEITPQCIGKLLELDFPETKATDQTMSQDDILFLEKLSGSIHVDENGFLEMPLPFREKPDLPNNIYATTKRLEYLKRKLTSNKTFYEDYCTFMTNILKNDEAEEVPIEEVNKSENVWYIPHQGVYNSKKPDKIRIVFDCSARYKGTALNDHLLDGPDLTNSIVGVLCRFRLENVAVMCDIERMFHMFKVEPPFRDYLRFLWWKDGDLNAKPTAYRMKVHLFGASSSPGCSNFGLKKTAIDGESTFSQAVCDFIRDNFYVDDGLISLKTEKEAVVMVRDSIQLCATRNLHLHKFVTNSKLVLDSIPVSQRAANMKDVSLPLPIERALGVEWNVESDVFQFRLTFKDTPFTRRGLLMTVASIFDPLGFISPFVLLGRLILKELCADGASWDDRIPDSITPRWERWKREVLMLADYKVPRCYHPPDFGEIAVQEIHHFSDASDIAIAECSYFRMINTEGLVHCSLIIGKARVAPKKITTTPRLELTAAVVSAKMSNLLRNELSSVTRTREVFWTDSEVTLGYINNDARKFHVFVANRVQRIRDFTKPSQWFYVSTDCNPADQGSRGLDGKSLLKSSWLTGPEFLWENSIKYEDYKYTPKMNDPEMKKAHVFQAIVSKSKDVILEKAARFSCLTKLLSAFTILRDAIYRKIDPPQCLKSLLERRKFTELFLIKKVQYIYYTEEIVNLQNGHEVKSKKVGMVDPFLDGSGILRVGGRLLKSSLEYGVKHPIILPKDSHLSLLIARHHHNKIFHQGRGMTVNAIRSAGYWIIGCTPLVANMVYKCVTCRKLRGKCSGQKMADLPEDRLEPSPPFTYVGTDCFGPFVVRDGRKSIKRYGVIFTCLASRAVHLEILDDMSTDAFVNSLRILIAIRGPIRLIRCDQGSNFVGAKFELKESLKKMDLESLKLKGSEFGCEFKFNFPSSSHMGGVWERQIRSIRSVLTGILDQHSDRLDTSSLRTVMYECMAVVNSRPLTVESLSDPHMLPITPNNLLTMKSDSFLPPPGVFFPSDVYARKRWRRVQFLANEFWQRWRKEFLINLNARRKWLKPQRNVKVDDVVILKSDNILRNTWNLAIVHEVFPSDDSLVRKVKLRLPYGNFLDRPIHKLVVLVEA